jgi:1,4-alpha-glucan branching enzyme
MRHHTSQFLGSRLSDDGVDFRVWAPFAQSVSVLVGEEYHWTETPLDNIKGYWSGTAIDAAPGQSYKYKIVTVDGLELERNDPRGRQLTSSENGASIIIDPAYDWGDTEQPIIPKEKQILYELHIGTFNRLDAATPGTFSTAIEKLDYLQNLGINMIELMPVVSRAPGQDWGYAINHLFSVDTSYGGRRGLLDFVKACHKRGMGVILDVVYNHFFVETDLWQFDGWSENNRGGIYFYNDERGDTPWGGRPDYGRPEVRQFILDNVTMWLTEYRMSGLRVDSTIYMRNSKGPDGDGSTEIPEAWTLLQEMTRLAHSINPDSIMTAEDSSVNDLITSAQEEGGAGFDAQWALALPHTIRSMLDLETSQYGDSLVK